MRTPALFLGHGHPLNALLDNEYTQCLTQWGQHLEKPEFILMVSAHWESFDIQLGTHPMPPMIYDFGNFSPELFHIQYPASGAPQWAAQVETLLGDIPVKRNIQRGFDHGVWTVLKWLFPDADIPILQLSLAVDLSPLEHYQLAKRLAPLREQGMMLIGSGNIVHNLGQVHWQKIDHVPPYRWAVQFDEWVKECCLNAQHDDLIHYQRYGQAALLSVPTAEHYLPLLYVLAMQQENESVNFVFEGFQNAAISMRCVQIG
jgi:4,5-DOPA dioxygenase extradiol